MNEVTVGFSVLHLSRIAVDAGARRAALDLLESCHWGGPLRYFSSVATAGLRLWRPPGMIAAKELREAVDDGLQADSMATLMMATDRRHAPGHRALTFTRDAHDTPFSISHGYRPAKGSDVDEWVHDVVTFFDLTGGGTGVVAVMASDGEIKSECGEGAVWRNDRLAHPFPDQHQRLRWDNRPHIGTRYMRFPRWGTLVSHDHVAQLGGADAIAKAVEPAVVRPLAGGVYFQLTASVATAMGAESAARQEAFTAFAEPLLPPPVTPPG